MPLKIVVAISAGLRLAKDRVTKLWHSLLLLITICHLHITSYAQTVPSKQVWGEFLLNYSFANAYNLENAFTYSTNLDAPRWRSFDYAPTLTWSVLPYLDLQGGLTFSFVAQNDSSNTFEIRPMLGFSLNPTSTKRIQTALLARFEQRNFLDLESDLWENSSRVRTRAAVLVPINRTSYYEDKMAYGILDAEFFWVLDQDVNERFANRIRLRIGAGYRFSYQCRLEVIYLQQFAKNTIGEHFNTSDDILRIRFKYYIEKKKPKSEESNKTEKIFHGD